MSDIQKYSRSSIEDLLADLEKKKDFANILIKSKLIPSALDTPEKVLVCLFKAQELGLPSMAALEGMAVINGKTTLQGNLILAMINGSGKLAKLSIDSKDEYCAVTMSRKDYDFTHTETFSLADATKAGLTQKQIWKQYPRTMLKWRTVSNCARIVFPEVIGGLYTPEEIASIVDADIKIDDSENVIVEEIKEPKRETKKEPEHQEAKFEDLPKQKPLVERVREKLNINVTPTIEKVKEYWESIVEEYNKETKENKKIINNEFNTFKEFIANQPKKEEKPSGIISKAEITQALIDKVTKTTTELELQPIDNAIDNMEDSEAEKFEKIYNDKLKAVGNPYEYKRCPF